jgi:CubicO group peptidase (beta-lactamase class C family)
MSTKTNHGRHHRDGKVIFINHKISMLCKTLILMSRRYALCSTGTKIVFQYLPGGTEAMKTKLILQRFSHVFAGIALFLLPHFAWGTTPLEADATISSGVNSKFTFATGANAVKPGGVVGVILDGKLVFQRGYGMSDVAGGIPNSASAPFYLASASKQFTAMSVLLCQEKGLLTLNDELRLHIPELDPVFDGVKIQHMLNMISAIYDVGTGNQTNNANAMLSGLIAEGKSGIVATELPIGSTMKYTNMNYVLLAIIVERVTGKTLRQFAQEEIFSKLGMNDTVIHDDSALIVTNQPNGYDNKLVLWSTATTTSPATGSTGVISTIADLAKWHLNFYANQLGNKDQNLITLMETPGLYTSGANSGKPVSNTTLGLPSYACGLMPDSPWNKNSSSFMKRVWHTGRWMGFKTATYRYPEMNMSVFVLLNRDDQFPDAQSVADVFIANVRFATEPPPTTAERGVAYHFKYSATGWPRPTYTLESGSLPNGITLNPDGTLAGTPTISGDFSGVVKATSSTKTQNQNFTIHVAEPAAYTLSVTLAGAGGGTITSTPQGTDPSGIACTSGTCSTTFPPNTSVELLPSPNAISSFVGWEGDCSGSGACTFSMTGQKGVTATFSSTPKAMIGTNGYASLASAYTAATTGNTILAMDTEMAEELILEQNKTVTLKGGYTTDFTTLSGLPTVLKGTLKISKGRLTMDGIVVRLSN